MTTTEKKTTTTTEKKTAPEKKAPAKKRPARKPSTKAAKTEVKGITPPVKTGDIDWEFQRRHQSKPMSKDEVQELLTVLATHTELEVEVKTKYHYGLTIRHEGKTLGEYWAKRDFPRVIITDKRRENKKLPIDWTARTAIKPESRGSDLETEMTSEIVCTPDEAIQIFLAMAAQSAQPESTEKKQKPNSAKAG